MMKGFRHELDQRRLRRGGTSTVGLELAITLRMAMPLLFRLAACHLVDG